MIIQVDCAGNLGLVHALFRELGLADAVNTSTKDQQLVAHLDTPDWPTMKVITELARLVGEGFVAEYSLSLKRFGMKCRLLIVLIQQ